MLLQDGMGTVPWIRGSFGQPCLSPSTPFPSALPITGPTASSCASAKVGNGVWRGCGGPAALQHLNPPYLGKTSWPRTSLPHHPCLAPSVGIPLPQGGQRGEAKRGVEETLGFCPRRAGNGSQPREHTEGEGGKAGSARGGGSCLCSESGDMEWVLGYHAGRGGGGCLVSVCKGDRATCHQEHPDGSLLS